MRRWQDCDETRQQPLAVKLLIRPTSPAGPVPAAAGGQVPSKARGQSEQGSRLPLPAVTPGSVTEQTLNAGTTIAKDNGAMDFIANATGAIYAEAWTPELQKMVGGRQTSDIMLKDVQAEYVKELSR